jgi:hypothetical protein
MKALLVTFLIAMNALLSLQWFAHEGAEATMNRRMLFIQSERDSLQFEVRTLSSRLKADFESDLRLSNDLKEANAEIQNLKKKIYTMSTKAPSDSTRTK